MESSLSVLENFVDRVDRTFRATVSRGHGGEPIRNRYVGCAVSNRGVVRSSSSPDRPARPVR